MSFLTCILMNLRRISGSIDREVLARVLVAHACAKSLQDRYGPTTGTKAMGQQFTTAGTEKDMGQPPVQKRPASASLVICDWLRNFNEKASQRIRVPDSVLKNKIVTFPNQS
jgi:hypothetical protein